MGRSIEEAEALELEAVRGMTDGLLLALRAAHPDSETDDFYSRRRTRASPMNKDQTDTEPVVPAVVPTARKKRRLRSMPMSPIPNAADRHRQAAAVFGIVLQEVIQATSVERGEIMNTTLRTPTVTRARWMLIGGLRRRGWSNNRIAVHLRCDHTSIRHAVRVMTEEQTL